MIYQKEHTYNFRAPAKEELKEYLQMLSKESLINERDQLELKIDQLLKLTTTKEFGNLSINEAKLVKKQLAAMKQYYSILKQRLEMK